MKWIVIRATGLRLAYKNFYPSTRNTGALFWIYYYYEHTVTPLDFFFETKIAASGRMKRGRTSTESTETRPGGPEAGAQAGSEEAGAGLQAEKVNQQSWNSQKSFE